MALEYLFGFGHTQSDDVKDKKKFIKNVKNSLTKHNVVIADKCVHHTCDVPMNLTSTCRNNHLRLHRTDLRGAAQGYSPPVRLLALNWALEESPAEIHRICSDRICSRGEKHQTLQADAHGKSHEDVIQKFINERDELGEDEVDVVIEMDINEDLEHALDRAVEGCVRILGLEKPDQEKVALALAAARGYEPTKKMERKAAEKTERRAAEKPKKGKLPRYYGFVPEVDLLELLNPIFSPGGDANVADGKKIFGSLKRGNRITTQPHVTIVHSNSLDPEWARELWDRCSELHLSSTPPTFQLHLGSVVWDDRVMAVVVDKVVPVDGDEAGNSFVDQLPQEVRNKLHITVGTARGDIKPFEACALVEGWRDGKGIKSLQLTNLLTEGPIKGLFS